MAVRWPTLVLAALFLFQAPALAQPGPKQMLARMDADGDGRIAREEWRGPPPAFAKLDADADGYLSPEELQARAGRGPSPAADTLPRQGQPAAGGPASGWIDSHVHLRKGSGTYAGALRHAVELMDGAGVRAAVLLSPPFPASGRAGNRYDVAELSRLTEAFPGRFLFLGGGHLLNGMIEGTPPERVTEALRADFTRKAEQILASGARGFGEMGMMHLGHFPGHPSYRVRPDHPLFLLLADIAGRHRAVIDIHMDVVEHDAPTPTNLRGGDNPPQMQANLALFERFVAHNRDARIVLAHAGWDVTGQWSAALSRRLLSDHANLYMSLKITGRGTRGSDSVLSGRSVDGDWLAVFEAFPDRFVFGSDSFIAEPGAKGRAPGGMTQFHGDQVVVLLKALPPGLARRIASENARRIYGEP